MKAEIRNGVLNVWPENNTEKFALEKWGIHPHDVHVLIQIKEETPDIGERSVTMTRKGPLTIVHFNNARVG